MKNLQLDAFGAIGGLLYCRLRLSYGYVLTDAKQDYSKCSGVHSSSLIEINLMLQVLYPCRKIWAVPSVPFSILQ